MEILQYIGLNQVINKRKPVTILKTDNNLHTVLQKYNSNIRKEYYGFSFCIYKVSNLVLPYFNPQYKLSTQLRAVFINLIYNTKQNFQTGSFT